MDALKKERMSTKREVFIPERGGMAHDRGLRDNTLGPMLMRGVSRGLTNGDGGVMGGGKLGSHYTLHFRLSPTLTSVRNLYEGRARDVWIRVSEGVGFFRN